MKVVQVTAGGMTEQVMVKDAQVAWDAFILSTTEKIDMFIQGLDDAFIIVPHGKLEMLCVFDPIIDGSNIDNAIQEGISKL